MSEKTLNYDIFSTINCNRPVDQNHVNRLIDAIHKKNLLHLHPILCNSVMEIIDGQHRLEAAKQLGVEVWYQVDQAITDEDIATINSNSKNWTQIDYINYWTSKGKPGFEVISEFMVENPLIPVSTVTKLFQKDVYHKTTILKDGILDISNREQAALLAGLLMEYSQWFKYAYDRNFIMALLRCLKVKGFDLQEWKRKLELQPRSLVRCIDIAQYLEMIEDIYNYGNTKFRLKIAA